jgi:hypothetical protein
MDPTSHQIEDDARAEIAGDPRTPDPAEVVDSVATLRGTVGSFARRHAWAAPGARAVEDAIVVDYRP